MFSRVTSDDSLTRCPEPLPQAPFARRPHVPRPRSAARVRAGAAAERSEGSLDAGEHRGPMGGRWATVYPQILPKTQTIIPDDKKLPHGKKAQE